MAFLRSGTSLRALPCFSYKALVTPTPFSMIRFCHTRAVPIRCWRSMWPQGGGLRPFRQCKPLCTLASYHPEGFCTGARSLGHGGGWGLLELGRGLTGWAKHPSDPPQYTFPVIILHLGPGPISKPPPDCLSLLMLSREPSCSRVGGGGGATTTMIATPLQPPPTASMTVRDTIHQTKVFVPRMMR